MNSQEKKMSTSLINMTRKLLKQKKKLYSSIVIGFMIGCIIAYSIPRKYTVIVSLSPESGQSASGGLSSITSMLGISSLGNSDEALNVSLFPELIKSTPFILEMLDVKVHTKNEDSLVTLSDYMKKQKSPWWNTVMGIPSKITKSFKKSSPVTPTEQKKEGPLFLTPDEHGKIKQLKACLSAKTDKKTNITQIKVELQDPIAAAITADSAMAKLQAYITEYRAKKATEDCIYLQKLYNQRKQEYYIAQKKYASFSDANRNIVLQMTKLETERLQNEKDLAYQVYSQISTQLQLAQAKVQEAKPVFAIVEPASVPLYPSSPNKPLIIIAFIFLSFISTVIWILFSDQILYYIRILKQS